MYEGERWLPVVGYEGLCEVSDRGRVRRVGAASGAQVGHVLSLVELRKRGGYFAVGLRNGQKCKMMRVHRLVAAAFIGPSDLPLVRHLDGNPKNNYVSNLAYGDASQNAQDRTLHGRSRDSNQNTGKTHCKYGHEFTPENTIFRTSPNGRPARRCRECRRSRGRQSASGR